MTNAIYTIAINLSDEQLAQIAKKVIEWTIIGLSFALASLIMTVALIYWFDKRK